MSTPSADRARACEETSGPRPPRVDTLRLVGPAAEHAKGRVTAPLGARFAVDAGAYAVALGPPDVIDVASVARALLDPDDLPAGTLLVVLAAVIDPPSLTSRFLAALGRGRTASRALRSTALVARGYVNVGAAIDPRTRSDLVWGYSAGPAAPAVSE